MSDVNYISPSSIMPQLGQVQIPGLAGVLLGQQQTDYRDVMEMQKFLSGVGAQKAQIGLEELVRDLPKKAIERERDIQGAGLDLFYKPEERDLSIRDKRASTKKTEDTLDSTILSTNAKNLLHATTDNIDRQEAPLRGIMALRNMIGEDGDPASLQRVLEAARGYGMTEDSPIYKHLAGANNPEDLKARLNRMERHLQTKKSGDYANLYGKDLNEEIQRAKQENLITMLRDRLASQERVATGRNETAIDVARIQAEARVRAAGMAKQSVTKTLEQRLTQQLQAGDKVGAQETAGLMSALKQAKDMPQIGFLLAMQQVKNLPKESQGPEAMMRVFGETMDKLNNQFEIQATGGGGIQPNPPGGSPTMPGPGGLTQEKDLAQYLAGVVKTPEERAQMLQELQQELTKLPPGETYKRQVYSQAIQHLQNESTGGTPEATAPTQPAQKPKSNEINTKFEEFMKNRKRNEVPR